MEAILLAMVGLSAWAYGAVHPGFEFLLVTGVGLLVVLWGARFLLEGRLSWKNCPVVFGLTGVWLVGIWQLTPLPRPLLRVLSPATARLYDQLLPSQPEQLPAGAAADLVVKPAGLTISLYPHATRTRLVRLLALILVFAVVRHNLASPVALRRLGVVALLSGVLLSLFALVQLFTSPRGQVYWSYSTLGQVFGPFICHNHYPYYVNMCIGLGFGVLWARRTSRHRLSGERRHGPRQSQKEGFPLAGPSSEQPRWLRAIWSRRGAGVPWDILQDPVSLWIGVALALMLVSILFSLSRGGFLALVGGFIFCLLVRLSCRGGSLRVEVGLLCLALALGLTSWLGWAQIEARLSTLWQGKALQEGRLPLWSDSLRSVKDFPVWGTGYGTYQYVEPLYRTTTLLASETIDHVHNDYIEMLVEGGLVGLVLILLVIGHILRRGYRAVRWHRSHRARSLALGALLAFVTVVIHSIGDFGLHIPAIALFATVICAHLSDLGSGESESVPNQYPGELDRRNDKYRIPLRALAPVLAAVTCLALALLLFGAGLQMCRTEALRLAAFQAGQQAGVAGQAQAIEYLEAAARLTPDDVELHTELGEAHARLFTAQKESITRQNTLGDAVNVVLIPLSVLTPPGIVHVTPTTLPGWLAVSEASRKRADQEEQQLEREHLVPALRHFLQGRGQCPLFPGPHLGLAARAALLAAADPPEAYLSRVELVAPCDPTLWYYCGLQHRQNGHPERAWESWRRCLDLSEQFLPQILDRSARVLGTEELVQKVLPDRPAVLLAAASRLYPQADAVAERTPFLRKALVLLDTDPAALSTPDLHTKATIQKTLGQAAEALALYQTLLAREPFHPGWRMELAQLFYKEGQLNEARAELLTVLSLEPKHAQAQALLLEVTKEIATRQ
jgi:O-antigen ligase/tetratricopeptide (TPR) repeat protein